MIWFPFGFWNADRRDLRFDIQRRGIYSETRLLRSMRQKQQINIKQHAKASSDNQGDANNLAEDTCFELVATSILRTLLAWSDP